MVLGPTTTDPARRKNMQAIRSRGNRSTEWRLRAMLVRRGIRGWETHARDILGVPDFFFPVERLAVFVDGCFWHCCPKCGHMPKSNVTYWQPKIGRNKARDRRVSAHLRKSGYTVLRIWECDIRLNLEQCAVRVSTILQSKSAKLVRSGLTATQEDRALDGQAG